MTDGPPVDISPFAAPAGVASDPAAAASDEAAVAGDSDDVDIAQGAVDQARQFHADIPNLHFI